MNTTRHVAYSAVSNLTELFDGANIVDEMAAWNVAAALLFLLELFDQSHEMVLGNHPLVPTSELWSWLHTFQQHPNSYWHYHPYSLDNSYLHAIVHRTEGHR